ncbi:regulator of nonsense transcripts 3A isoform X2 [Scyliorhinus canicula]|uniref:regulator of nonsense transcripts 3A isoform X2 n=1 Tax=Scyliorhinus canicula TaxID=7830 RepID=UPI0018F6614B|nr:regulator of nonsense transcripts 3A isoform X2 [Scyliorhinus canicula]
MKEEKENKGRERRVEIQFRDREEGEKRKDKDEKKEVLTKVVIRRLPPNLTRALLEEQLHPLPTHDYFEFCAADISLYPHLFSRAYINFKNPDDIILFRDRFDGYIFIDNKGQEYPAVVEFAPFQKISKRKLKKKDAKSGSIEEDPEYRKFLESYCADEEKIAANPETLLGEIEAKTRELIVGTDQFLTLENVYSQELKGVSRTWKQLRVYKNTARRTTPLLEYIKNKKLEKQRIREEKREERRRRELEKKRLREEEKRKRREEERRKRKEAEKQKKLAEKERKEEIKIKLLKKADKEEEKDSDKWKEKAEDGDGKWEKLCCPGNMQGKRPEIAQKDVKDKQPNDSDRERKERERERRLRERERERQRRREDERRKQKERYEVERAMRTKEEETKRGKEHGQEREKKGDSLSYMFSTEKIDKLGKEDKNDDMGSKRERIRNKVNEVDVLVPDLDNSPELRGEDQYTQIKNHQFKQDRPAMQLYQPGARCRTRLGSGGKAYDCCSKSSEDSIERKYEDDSSVGAGSEKSCEE